MFSLIEIIALGDLILIEFYSKIQQQQQQQQDQQFNISTTISESDFIKNGEDISLSLTNSQILFEMRMNFLIACIKQNTSAYLSSLVNHFRKRKIIIPDYQYNIMDRVFESLSKEFYEISMI
jgi:hypothetical protein